MSHRTPEECTSLQEIRAEIDFIDAEIVKILGKRLNYVRSAARFKPDSASVRVPERITSMLKERRTWAEQEGMSPDAVEQLFHDWIEYSISEELKCWLSRNRPEVS